MKGNERIIEALNARLIEEATGIAQYSAHRAAVANWGYQNLVAMIEEHAADETKHFNWLLDHIYFLGGVPVVGRYGQINLGNSVLEFLDNDYVIELNAINRYSETIDLCIELKDSITRKLLEEILSDERDHINDQETQLAQVVQMGMSAYLSQQIG
jgi:bacterioferritin